MKIKVYTIQLDTPPWLRRAVVYLAVPAAAILGVSAVVYADVVVPNTFATGDVLDAEKMNDNFAVLRDGVNASTLTSFGTASYSVGPTRFVGATATGGPYGDGTYSGAMGGYQIAKSLCEAVGGPAAHVCTSEEMVRSEALGVAIPKTGWIAAGIWSWYSVAGIQLNDCAGFTWSTAQTNGGTVWTGHRPQFAGCDEKWAVLCCN